MVQRIAGWRDPSRGAENGHANPQGLKAILCFRGLLPGGVRRLVTEGVGS